MPIYLVVSPPQPSEKSLAAAIRSNFNENDRHEILSDVWVVRSPFVTTEQVRDSLGIKVGGFSGIVVAAGRYTGVADRALVEKLQVWEGME